MSHKQDYSYLGSGIILIREWGSNAAFAEIGNCSAFSVSPQVNNLTLADFTNPGGGIQNRVDRVTDWTLMLVWKLATLTPLCARAAPLVGST